MWQHITPNPCPPPTWRLQCKKHNVDCSPPQTTARLLDKLVGEFLESQVGGALRSCWVATLLLVCPLSHRSRTAHLAIACCAQQPYGPF